MSFSVARSWRAFVLAKEDRRGANKNEITIFVFSITAKDFSHGVLLDGKGTIRRSRRAPVRGRSAASAPRLPRAATQPPRRRAWLRIFVVRCSLPCDPPVGGHSCNGGVACALRRHTAPYKNT